MALTYVKLANVTADIAAGELVRATVLASVGHRVREPLGRAH